MHKSDISHVDIFCKRGQGIHKVRFSGVGFTIFRDINTNQPRSQIHRHESIQTKDIIAHLEGILICKLPKCIT